MQNESVGLECGEALVVEDEAFWVEAVVLIVKLALEVIVELAMGAGGVGEWGRVGWRCGIGEGCR